MKSTSLKKQPQTESSRIGHRIMGTVSSSAEVHGGPAGPPYLGLVGRRCRAAQTDCRQAAGNTLQIVRRTSRFYSGAVAALVCFLCFADAIFAADPNDPAAELASFKIADGFQASLFASELDGVVKPIQIRFDIRGRLWVIGSSVYPQIKPGQVPDDKVLILEDSNHDGHLDKVTVFADGLMVPTGLEVMGDGRGCYVGEGPVLWQMRDTDGDDHVDDKRVLLRGFGTGDAHQNINSFRWGPGGDLWFCQGLHNNSRVETPWGVQSLDQAGIWRLWPKRLKLEGFYGSAAEPQNPWGWVFTDWGEPIELAGNNSSIIYPVPGLVPDGRPDQPTLIWREGRGRKMSGGEIVETSAFPDDWQGRLIIGGYINNAVWVLNAADDGSGFSLSDAEPLITTTDKDFRPVDVKFGPDGALYLADWYNPIIGHYQASFRHPDRDHVHGRIWRITAKGRPLTKPPQLADPSIDELLADLGSKDRWTRDFAKHALAARPTDDVAKATREWVDQTARTELELKEALGVFQSQEVVEPALLERLVNAKEPGARAYAASVIGDWADRLENPLPLLAKLANDENARVRLHTIVAAAWIPKSESINIVLNAASHGGDPFIDFALRQAVHSLKPVWLPALQAGQLAAASDVTKLGLLVRYDGSPDTLDVVRKLIDHPTSANQNQLALLQTLAGQGEINDLVRVLSLDNQALLRQLLPTVVRSVRLRLSTPPVNAAELIKPLIENSDDSIREEALRLAGIWKVEAFRPTLITKASNSPAAMDGLVAMDSKAAAEVLVRRMRYDSSGNGFADYLDPFLDHKDAVNELLAAVKANAPVSPAPSLARQALHHLNQRGLQFPELKEMLERNAVALTNHWQWSDEFARELAADVRQSGNPARGREILHRPDMACLSCHHIGNEGGIVGPPLDTLGTAQPVDFIVGAILEPTKEIKEGYEAYEIETKSGDLLTGYRIRSDRNEVVLRETGAIEPVTLRRDQVKSERSIGTLMPSGLADVLSREELRDLVAYLSTLGKPSQ